MKHRNRMEKAYYEIYFKKGTGEAWGFTCGYCGRVIDSRSDISYWKLRDFDFMNSPLNMACSERCIKQLFKEQLGEVD